MRQPPPHDNSTNLARFWRSYVHIGVLTYTMGALAVVVYAMTAPVPHREAMVILGSVSLAMSVGPFRWLGLRLVATRWSKWFFTSWAACTFVFIALGAVLDGGVRSPIAYFLVLPMLFAGLAYSAGTVSFLAAFGVATSLVVGVLTPHRSWSTTAFLSLAVVIAGVITAAAALFRDRLMDQLIDAANLDALDRLLEPRGVPATAGRRSEAGPAPSCTVQSGRGRPGQPQGAQRLRRPPFGGPRPAVVGRGAAPGGPGHRRGGPARWRRVRAAAARDRSGCRVWWWPSG